MKTNRWLLGCVALVALGACVQIGGIDDPKPREDVAPGPWAMWPMPNPPSSGLPNPASYSVDEANDVVVDNVTGLMWQRTADSNSYSWEEAKMYCKNLVHGGFSDWRLPSRIELVSLVDFTNETPAIDLAAFPKTAQAVYWTCSPLAASSSEAWAAQFNFYGNPYHFNVAEAFSVRCVR